MRERSMIRKLLIVMLVAVVAMLTLHAAVAKDNPPGCKNEVPGANGFKNPNCPEGPPPVNECTDGQDNDGDGATDGFDRDCDNGSTHEGGSVEPACSNGVDDDTDTKVDGDDPGCTDDNDTDETDAPPPVNECTDGLDNDGDGATDGFDRDCDNGSTHEGGSTEPACSNGVDDDGDTKVDGADPGCADDNDNDETDPVAAPECSDTIDNDGDGAADGLDEGCTGPNDPDESTTCANDYGDDGTVHSTIDPTADETGPVSSIVHGVDQALVLPVLTEDGGVVPEVNCALVAGTLGL
jgi:hypothetical protein